MEIKTGISSLMFTTTSSTLDFNVGLYDNNTEDLALNPCTMLHLEPPISGHAALKAVPMPAFDNDRWPGSLALPFSVGQRLFSVDDVASDPRSSPPLVRYYRLAVRCMSPAPNRFLRDMRRWLETSVAPLLESHSRWYPVLAGASYVIRATAAHASGSQTYARRMVERVLFNATASTDKNGDDDDWEMCDDSVRLPNVNVFLLVVFLSLTLIWTGLGVLRCHKAVRFTFEPLEVYFRHALR